MATADFLIHEGPGIEIVAVVDYDIIPASGDGHLEPREPAHLDFNVTRLVQRKRCMVRNGLIGDWQTVWGVTELAIPTDWVKPLIDADEDWQHALLADDVPDPDSYRDDLISRELNPA